MSLLDEILERVKVTEMILNAVVIDRVITMIVSVWTPWLSTTVQAVPVVVPGGQPNCSYSQVLEIGQLVDDAFQIPTVIRTRVISIIGFWWRVGGDVVSCVAVCESIDHDQVNHISARDALKMSARIKRRF